MRESYSEEVERGRDRSDPHYATAPGDRCGAFRLRCPLTGERLTVIAGDGSDWDELGLPPPRFEHVSVRAARRCPTWEEMCWVKDLFFGPEELALQYHPPRSRYVNDHEYVLHLWRPVGAEVPAPPLVCV